MRRTRLLPLLLVLAACSATPALAPDAVAGDYYSGQPGASLRLRLAADGTFRVDGSGLLGRKVDGVWSLDGERLMLHTDDETARRGDRVLLLRVESRRVYLVEEELVASFDDGSIERDEGQAVFHRLLPDER